MPNLYITEYQRSGLNAVPGIDADQPVATEPALANQKVAYTTATQSAAFNANTLLIRLLSDTNCHVLFGANPTATTQHQFLLANVEYWRAVQPGQRISVVQGA